MRKNEKPLLEKEKKLKLRIFSIRNQEFRYSSPPFLLNKIEDFLQGLFFTKSKDKVLE